MRALSDRISYSEPDEDGNNITVTLTAAEAIQRQLAAVAASKLVRPGFQYESDEQALEDFMVIHWAWWE